MKNILLTFAFFIVAFQSITQEYNWLKQYEIQITPNSTWTIDNFNNLYLTNNDVLSKFDEKGKKTFEQSFKKFGKISQIDARNPMKILIFCEDQQMIFYIDNTLSKQEIEMDLSDFGYNYVTKVSASDQADKIWIYDQNNSEITLSTQRQGQSFKLENITGLLGIHTINELYETNDYLYITEYGSGIYVLDKYGSLTRKISNKTFKASFVYENTVLTSQGNELIYLNTYSQVEKKMLIPLDQIKKFKVNQTLFYFENEGKIHVYKIEKK